MKSFLTRYGAEIKGVLSGFDRIRFRGTMRWLSSLRGMTTFLSDAGILLKEFSDWAKGLTDRIRKATERLAHERGRAIEYLASSQIRKEERALAIAEADGVREGLAAVLTAVEPCASFSVSRNRQAKKLELRYGSSKCLHQYFYLRHPRLGLMHARLQTWLPFTVHVRVNGREWLAGELRRAGIGFEQRDTTPADKKDARRRSARVTERLRLLRAHGLIHKVPKSHRYQLSDRGRQLITAFTAAHGASVEKLLNLAAY